MDENTAELLEKIRQQFDFDPYPKIPLERSPKNESRLLAIHNLVTPYYLRNKKIINSQNKIILDAGCGTGYKSLVLAEANPGAKIIGIDLSEESLKIARQRLIHHGFDNAKFYHLSIYDLPSLGLEFDYINCDELLYLFPEPAVALKAMKSVLKPEGIIRSNLHSALQRSNFFRAQEVFRMMGLMDNNPEEMEIDIALETMKALKDNTDLKLKTWRSSYEGEEKREKVLMNYLFQGDKGYRIIDQFSFLRRANLEFISMVNWREWDLMSLFKEPDNLPVFLTMSLPEISLEERLTLFELLHPIHRLLDFWCGHPEQAKPFVPIAEWTKMGWQKATIDLPPQLKKPAVKEQMIRSTTQLYPLAISQYFPATGEQFFLDSSIVAFLLPLVESPQSMGYLVERWQKLRPVNPVTLEETPQEETFDLLIQALTQLEEDGYVFVEGNPLIGQNS